MKSSLFRVSLIVLLLAASAAGQTQIDLRTQAKDVDFSSASSTKPAQTGTSLPAVCAQGQVFLLSNATLGQNLYVCTAANVWTRQGGAAMLTQLSDFAVTRTSAQALAIGANCGPATPCNVRVGSTVYSITLGCTATLSGSGTGTAYIYFTSAGALTIGHNLTVAATSGCTSQSGVAAFPAGSIPLYTWSAVSGAWDVAGGLDYRAMLATKGVTTGNGLLMADSVASTNITLDSAVVPMYLTTTALLDFPSIANGACSADLTFTLGSAAVSDAVAPGLPSGLEAGLVVNMRVSAPSTIAVRVCNLSGAAVDPASATYRATIVRSF